jgi:hypothetical protein
MSRLPKVKCGDIFEITTTKGYGYFQCVKETPVEESETIRILPGVYQDVNEAKLDTLVNEKELYFISFPLKYALKKECVRYVGNFKVPASITVPKYYRDILKIKGKFICWHIVDSETLQRRSVEKLSEDEKRLSPWGSWNDTLLAERIAEGWTLDKWV